MNKILSVIFGLLAQIELGIQEFESGQPVKAFTERAVIAGKPCSITVTIEPDAEATS